VTVSSVDRRSNDNTPRLFFMTSVSGTFEAKEIPNPVANDSGIPSAYPFLQADLYIDEQPGAFSIITDSLCFPAAP